MHLKAQGMAFLDRGGRLSSEEASDSASRSIPPPYKPRTRGGHCAQQAHPRLALLFFPLLPLFGGGPALFASPVEPATGDASVLFTGFMKATYSSYMFVLWSFLDSTLWFCVVRGSMENYGRHFDNNEAQLPPGFRFHPTDEELITYYLLKKVLDSSFTGRAIAEIDLNKCEPWELPEKAKMGEKEWYFFSLRDRKYPTGLRTNRATDAGYWKATGKDREIYSSKTMSLVGMKKTLVFYKGRAPKGEKSNWVMHEYRLEGKFAYHFLSRSSKDEWVVSRVFQKCGCGGGSSKKTRPALAGSHFSNSGNTGGGGGCGSTSSSSLPPLLEPTPLPFSAGLKAPDRESCSYDSTDREPVPCFSTAAAAATGLGLHIPPPPQGPAIFGPNGAFPSLRSLHENLQLPFFLSGMSAQPVYAGPSPAVVVDAGIVTRSEGAGWPSDLDRKAEAAAAVVRAHPMPVGSTELDCLWTF
ncbi:hypothetical protein C4D60_Mb10t08330 [Musa balbisiana]|uniref:NAC domain-containing protein n=1 Tax=Musa balbisiana TaxID=52838 RepID=A0A4S8IVK2_MUSBA|nr:hypothetical protein C4D60_Mb10t08330 [Musa balbisiana]